MNGPVPYSFSAVYPLEQLIDVGTRAANGQIDLALAKHACGCLGCVLEKHDSEPDAFGAGVAMALPVDPETASVEELGAALRDGLAPGAEGDEAGAIPIWLVPILSALVQKLFDRWLKR